MKMSSAYGSCKFGTYRFLLLLFICFNAAYGESDNFEISFAQANELYKQGDFVKAYDLYLQIPNKSCAVYYNLGNCAYKMGKPGYALLYWRKAENDWGLFGRDELLKNIALVKKKALLDEESEQSIVHALKDVLISSKNSFISLIRAIPLFSLQLLVLLLWIFLFVYLRYLYRRKQRAIIIALFCFQALFAFSLAIKYNLQSFRHLVVIKPGAKLFSGPGDNFATLGHLSEAQELVMLKQTGTFYKVKVNSVIGWVDKNFVDKI